MRRREASESIYTVATVAVRALELVMTNIERQQAQAQIDLQDVLAAIMTSSEAIRETLARQDRASQTWRDAISQRMAALDARLDELRTHIDRRLDRVWHEHDALKHEVTELRGMVEELRRFQTEVTMRLADHDEQFAVLGPLEAVQARMQRLIADVDALAALKRDELAAAGMDTIDEVGRDT